MEKYEQWFREAIALTDEVERAQEVSDLAFSATQMLEEGERDNAIALCKLLLTLDRHDDLLHPAIETAEELLIKLGVIKLKGLDEVVRDLETEFADLDSYHRKLAIAKTIAREYLKRSGAAEAAYQMVLDAEAIRPLGKKDLKMKAELARAAGDRGRMQ